MNGDLILLPTGHGTLIRRLNKQREHTEPVEYLATPAYLVQAGPVRRVQRELAQEKHGPPNADDGLELMSALSGRLGVPRRKPRTFKRGDTTVQETLWYEDYWREELARLKVAVAGWLMSQLTVERVFTLRDAWFGCTIAPEELAVWESREHIPVVLVSGRAVVWPVLTNAWEGAPIRGTVPNARTRPDRKQEYETLAEQAWRFLPTEHNTELWPLLADPGSKAVPLEQWLRRTQRGTRPKPAWMAATAAQPIAPKPGEAIVVTPAPDDFVPPVELDT